MERSGKVRILASEEGSAIDSPSLGKSKTIIAVFASLIISIQYFSYSCVTDAATETQNFID